MDKLELLLSKFENGQERFKTDALFNKVIMHMMHCSDKYEIIEGLLDIINNQQEALYKKLR